MTHENRETVIVTLEVEGPIPFAELKECLTTYLEAYGIVRSIDIRLPVEQIGLDGV